MRNVEYFPIIAKGNSEESGIKNGILQQQKNVWGVCIFNLLSCDH